MGRHLAITVVFSATLYSVAPVVHAAQPAFQVFMRDACVAAAGTLDARCTESAEGELSGDSEDSLIPTQALSNNANALAQTRARIAAALTQQEALPGRDENKSVIDEASGTRRITQTFGGKGVSWLLQAEHGQLDREVSLRERGYETESLGLRTGVDYRLDDASMIGLLLGYDRYDQSFDTDAPGTNFTPQGNEGDSRADNWSVNLFGSRNLGERAYVEGLLSYTRSDYRFARNVVFQETDRVVPQTNVNTTARTSGSQWAVSIGGGYDLLQGTTNLGTYARLDHQNAEIDSYRESGGNGLAMVFESESSEETLGTLGLRTSRVFNRSFGVLVPQGFVEYVHAFQSDARTSASSFVEDGNATPFALVGDTPDRDYLNAGVSVVAVLPNGINAFFGYSQRLQDKFIDYYRLNAGVRVEY